MAPYAIAIIGGGVLAQERDLPALNKISDFNVVGVAQLLGDKRAEAADFDSLVARDPRWPALDAVAVCTPPETRYKLARAAIDSGMHVILEGRPTRIRGEIDELTAFAHSRGKSIYTAWPLQTLPAVAEAKNRLAKAKVRFVSVYLNENMGEWFRLRGWSSESQTLGIFEPGLHVLSALTKILPDHVLVESAFLGYARGVKTPQYPRDLAAPSSAYLTLKVAAPHNGHSHINAEFNWNQAGVNGWAIEVETDQNMSVRLTERGAILHVDGLKVVDSPDTSCEAAYRHFSQLIERGSSEIDASAIDLVDAAFSVGVNVTR